MEYAIKTNRSRGNYRGRTIGKDKMKSRVLGGCIGIGISLATGFVEEPEIERVETEVSGVQIFDLEGILQFTDVIEHTDVVEYTDEVEYMDEVVEIETDMEVEEHQVVVEEKDYRISMSEGEFELLVKIVEAEAEGEGHIGKVAVAANVINRVDSSLFPNTITEVVYQKNQYESVNNGRLTGADMKESTILAVEEALLGNDPTEGSLFFCTHALYHSDTKAGRWFRTLTPTAEIGGHIFTK